MIRLLLLLSINFQIGLHAQDLAELSREENRQIFQETAQYIQEHPLPSLEILVYPGNELIEEASDTYQTKILVVRATTFEMAIDLKYAGFQPLILDMANATKPGGGALEGAGAQEETLCRQSNLYNGLKDAYSKGYYPLPEFGGILIKNVSFLRDERYTFLHESFLADVFASAAYDCNREHLPDQNSGVRGYDRPSNEEDYEFGTKAKMRSLFQAAIENGNDALVLSAFGCGAFRNDPSLISKWYKEVLSEPEFQNAFKIIAFAIKGADSNLRGNFEVFQECFADLLAIRDL